MADTTVTNAAVERSSARPRAAHAGLLVLFRGGPAKPEPHRVAKEVTIGRGEDCDIVIEDPSVSRKHARVSPTSDGFFVTDLKSHNGTFINGAPVKEPKTHGPFAAVLRLGSSILFFVRDVAPFEAHAPNPFPEFVGGPAIADVRDRIARIAPSTLPVLIVGETGTGKELAARALHVASKRGGPFVTLNCAALAENLVESELFGHSKGAFSGASAARQGLFRAAHRGTLFLDELGELPMSLQPKLLRVIETGEVRAVGEDSAHSVDVRLVTATHRDLFAMAEQETFRSDLLHRIAAAQINIPPLRTRREDLAPLVARFLQDEGVSITATAFEALLLRHWPGNVREVRNAIGVGAANARANRAAEMDQGDLPEARDSTTEPAGGLAIKVRIESALTEHHGDVGEAARALGTSRTTLYETIRRLQIEPSRYRRRE